MRFDSAPPGDRLAGHAACCVRSRRADGGQVSQQYPVGSSRRRTSSAPWVHVAGSSGCDQRWLDATRNGTSILPGQRVLVT